MVAGFIRVHSGAPRDHRDDSGSRICTLACLDVAGYFLVCVGLLARA